MPQGREVHSKTLFADAVLIIMKGTGSRSSQLLENTAPTAIDEQSSTAATAALGLEIGDHSVCSLILLVCPTKADFTPSPTYSIFHLVPQSRPRRARANSLPSASRTTAEAPDWLLEHNRPTQSSRLPADSRDNDQGKSKFKPRLRRRSIVRRPHRDARRVNPDDHWLSEDEGSSQVESYMERQARLVQSGAVGGSSSGGPGPDDRDPPPSPRRMSVDMDDNGNADEDGDISSEEVDALKKATMSSAATEEEDTTMQPTMDVVVPSFYDNDSNQSHTQWLPDRSRLLAIANKTLACPHCQDRLSHPITLPCGHTVCAKCCLSASAPTATAPSSGALAAVTMADASPPLRSPLRSLSTLSHLQRQHRSSPSTSSTSSVSSLSSSTKNEPFLSVPSVVAPRCPLPVCHQQQQLLATSAFDGTPVKPCVVLVSLLGIVSNLEIDNTLSLTTMATAATATDKSEAAPQQEPASMLQKYAPAQDALAEVECQVCCNIMYEPITTRCSHTFCRQCLARSLDHSEYCPLCRSKLPGFSDFTRQKPSAALANFVEAAFPTQMLQRRIQHEEEAKTPTPIFVCTLSFPSVPTFLHIFEPRYRLMIRRAWDSDKCFGMCMRSPTGGIHPFGTLLEIQDYHVFEDGRSAIKTVGVSRFKLGATDVMDGYTVAQTQALQDISSEEEVAAEAEAVASYTTVRSELRERLVDPAAPLPTPEHLEPELTIHQLVSRCRDFLEKAHAGAAPWLRQQVAENVGPVPEDPSDLSFYMAALLPIYEIEKARMLEVRHLPCRANERRD